MPDFKMTKEQKALFDALTVLQKKVCINSISGLSNIDSYIKAGGKGKTQATKENSASQIFSKLEVKAFLDSMKAAAVSDAVMSRQRMLEDQTMIADIGRDRVPNMTLEELTEHKAAFDIKLKAHNQIADLAGYKAASKHDLTSLGKSMAPVHPSDLTDEELARIIGD